MTRMTKVRLRPHPHKGALCTWRALAATAMLSHLSHKLSSSDSSGRELCPVLAALFRLKLKGCSHSGSQWLKRTWHILAHLFWHPFGQFMPVRIYNPGRCSGAWVVDPFRVPSRPMLQSTLGLLLRFGVFWGNYVQFPGEKCEKDISQAVFRVILEH